MDSLASIAARQHGVFLTRQALGSGYADKEISRLVRRGDWVRLRRGAYCTEEVRTAYPGPAGLQQLRTYAVLAALAAPAVVSHVSAAVLIGLALYKAPMHLVHVTRPGNLNARTEGGVKHHTARLDAHEFEQRPDGIVVTSLARTAVDFARMCTYETGVVTVDAALNRGLSHADLQEMHESVLDWPGSRMAGRVVSIAQAGSESVGESLMRVAFDAEGLPRPRLQVEFRDSTNRVWARADAVFEEERTIVEFDGRVKYGEDPEVLFLEKLREDRLRDLGYEVVRVTWADLANPAALAAKIRAAFARARRRRAV